LRLFLLCAVLALASCEVRVRMMTQPLAASSPTPPLSERYSHLRYPELPKLYGTPGARLYGTQFKNWALQEIGFSAAQDMIYDKRLSPCSPKVIVAVIDTGIDYLHPALATSLWKNPGESGLDAKGKDKGTNGIDDDGNGFVDDVIGWDFVHDVPLPYDTHGHGTHISGIIAATTGSEHGSGVCPNASIMALKYYDSSGAGYNNLSNTVRAIEYATKMGAHIINYSGGGSDPAASERNAVEAANKQGILFVAAAGNDGHNVEIAPYYPGSYPFENILMVASINSKRELLPSTNFGKLVPLAAPGLLVLSTLPEGKYGTMSGTSQATALTSGAAAFLLSQNPLRRTNLEAKKWLVEGAAPYRDKNALGGGLLSLPGAVEKIRGGR
jgi:subtilisin family serine protease